MAVGLVGKKLGSTRVFTEEGHSEHVTVVLVEPNVVVQVKTAETDGYAGVQVTTGSVHRSRLNKAKAGHFAKANVSAGRGLWEFRTEGLAEEASFSVGDQLTVERFVEGALVDVRAKSKGKGFQGAVKRHNFSMQDATHGNSLSHRAPGSIGQNQSPGRVFKGKKMAGQMGNKKVCVQNQKIVRVDIERNLLLIKGGIPGAPGSDVIISPAVKAEQEVN